MVLGCFSSVVGPVCLEGVWSRTSLFRRWEEVLSNGVRNNKRVSWVQKLPRATLATLIAISIFATQTCCTIVVPLPSLTKGGGRRRDLNLGGGIQSPSSVAAVSTTVIPNGLRRKSESSRGFGTARAAADGDDLPGVSAAVGGGGGGGDDGRRGRTLKGNGRELARGQTPAVLLT